MARSLSEIYSEIKQKRNEYLELTSFDNDSKMSVMNAISYIMASMIWSVENMIDVFQVDIAKVINSHVNGTTQYYINALKSYQSGDSLVVSEDGTSFSYETVDESKRIVTCVLCSLIHDGGFYDRKLIFKIAKGANGNFSQVEDAELVNIRSYMRQISFAGTNFSIYSRKGDVLVPKILVCYDGNIAIAELKDNISSAIRNYLSSTAFTGKFYPSKMINYVGDLDHVVDVISEGYYDNSKLGVYVAQYNDSGHLMAGEAEGSSLTRFVNGVDLSSGFAREKSAIDTEETFQAWADSIMVITEDDLDNYTTESAIYTLNGVKISENPTLVVNGVKRSPFRV